MELFELQKCIKQKTLPNILILCGTDYALVDIYIQQIEKSLNLSKQCIGASSSVVVQNRGFKLDNKDKLYVCRHDKEYTTQESLWKASSKNLGKNYLVITLTSVDKRSKFFKFFNYNIVQFSEQSTDVVKTMLKKEQHTLTDSETTRLVEGCSNNYGACLIQLSNIKTLAAANKLTHSNAYKKLLSEGVLYECGQPQIKEFTESVVAMNKEKSFRLLKELKVAGENSIVILTWLYNSCKFKVLGGDIKYLDYMEYAQSCEQGIKNGTYDEKQAVELALIKIFN